MTGRRRRLLVGVGFLALAAGPLAAETIKLATLVPQGSIWDRALRNMAADWGQVSGGDIRVRIYPGGVAGDDTDVLRKVRIGQLQAAMVTVSGLSEIDPAFALFEVPMFFTTYDELFHVLGELETELEEKLLAKGLRLLHWGHGGWIHFFATVPVNSLADFRELKVFVWAGNDRMTTLWRENGFRPVPLAATDILTGLETGLFQVLPSTPIAALSLQWFRSAPFMVDLPLAPLIGATVIDERVWQRLPEAQRAQLQAAAVRAGRRLTAQIPGAEQQAVTEMKRRGLVVSRIVGSVQEPEWRTATGRFARAMRRAFVPEEFYDRATAIRDAYRQSVAATDLAAADAR